MSSSARPAALAPRAAGRAVPRRLARAIHRHRWPLLFVAPFVVLFAVCGCCPGPWRAAVGWARASTGRLALWAWLRYSMLIMLAGLQAIPPELAEAARVDGAGPVTVFFRITVPLLRPVIVFSITLSIIGTFSLFTEPAILFNPAGGPAHSAQTPVLEIWQTTF